MDGVSFGDFSEQEVSDLNTHTTDNLEFVWQRAPCSTVNSNSDSLRRLAVSNTTTPDKQKFPLGGLSPNIPPNPPTSPVEGLECERSKSPSKLNINALPFVPGTLSIIVPPQNSSTRSSPTGQSGTATCRKLYVGTCEERPSETATTEAGGSDREVSVGGSEDGRVKEGGGDHSHGGTAVHEPDNVLSVDFSSPPIRILQGGIVEVMEDDGLTNPPKPATDSSAPPTHTNPPTEQRNNDSSLFFTPTPVPPPSTQPHTAAPSHPHTSTSTFSSDSTSQSTAQSPIATIGASPQSPTATTGTTPTPSVWGTKKSWASIVGSSSTSSPSGSSTLSQPQSAKVTVGVATSGETQTAVDEKSRNVHLRELAEQLSKWQVSHAPVGLQPRGLVNQGNWCYMHAPLQALLACPGFFNLFHTLTNSFPALSRDPSPSPIADTMIQFVHEFKPYPKVAPASVPPPDPKSKKKKSRVEFHHGDPFRPDCVYEMLHKIKSTLSFKGRQEDAEEFLGCLLDGLHEEMVSAQKILDSTHQSVTMETEGSSSASASDAGEGGDSGDPGEGSEGVEWEQVGPKNKSAITRQTSFHGSPITEIFGGELRSSVHRQKVKESATLQPFFSLQLDIQSEEVWTVRDALEALSAKEKIDISESEAHKRLSLARLPPVLILHLKRFVFDKTGGSQKLLKQVQYSTEMEIGKDLLSPAIRNKLSTSQRSYRLWAVVYHHGKTATGGHYTCDVHHPACGGWIRADDSVLKPVPEEFVLKPAGSQPNKVAYILFYRRLDTIRT